ncbi:hypothetical protein MRX96_054556 [Rhipicephalus microplus]
MRACKCLCVRAAAAGPACSTVGAPDVCVAPVASNACNEREEFSREPNAGRDSSFAKRASTCAWPRPLSIPPEASSQPGMWALPCYTAATLAAATESFVSMTFLIRAGSDRAGNACTRALSAKKKEASRWRPKRRRFPLAGVHRQALVPGGPGSGGPTACFPAVPELATAAVGPRRGRRRRATGLINLPRRAQCLAAIVSADTSPPRGRLLSFASARRRGEEARRGRLDAARLASGTIGRKGPFVGASRRCWTGAADGATSTLATQAAPPVVHLGGLVLF